MGAGEMELLSTVEIGRAGEVGPWLRDFFGHFAGRLIERDAIPLLCQNLDLQGFRRDWLFDPQLERFCGAEIALNVEDTFVLRGQAYIRSFEGACRQNG